ncbi:MAG: DUF4350 domain-containing protein [Acidobacteriota bacterium]
MRQRLFIIITLAVVIIVLVGLNAASYVKVEETPDSEGRPDRSTFNGGATGTRALYDFLHESGHQVTRWRDSTASLLSLSGPKPETIVIVGRTAIPFSKAEAKELLRWVETGGRLVIVDRNPDRRLLPQSGDWKLSAQVLHYPFGDLDPNNLEQMTAGVKQVSASQPTLLAASVETILPSRFAAAITIVPQERKNTSEQGGGHSPQDNTNTSSEETSDESEDTEDTPQPNRGYEISAPEEKSPTLSPAPVANFATDRGALLVDYPHGQGRIVLLGDPFIVANNGISRADNLVLALNVVRGGGGLIAFDEFHQGHAITQNALIQYFEGTPILALCGQFALIGVLIVWSRGRRFGRPLPMPHVDRRSSLEFVASMAELQQRARAHDLALENIYGRVRRVLVRHAGLSNSSPRAEIAARVATRSGLNRQELETLMRNCEDTINGAPTNAKESLRLARRLREIESQLGLGTRARDDRQNAERSEL